MKLRKIILTFSLCFLAPNIALGDKCKEGGKALTVKVALIDTTTQLNQQNFKESFKTLLNMVKPNERLMVVEFGNKANSQSIKIDIVRPKGSMWMSKMKSRANDKVYKECLQKYYQSSSKIKGNAAGAAILETLEFTSKILRKKKFKKPSIFLFSKLHQGSANLNFQLKAFEFEKTLALAKNEALISDLRGAHFNAIELKSPNIDDRTARKIRKFWELLGQSSGATNTSVDSVLIK